MISFVEIMTCRVTVNGGTTRIFADIRLDVGWPEPLFLYVTVFQRPGHSPWVEAPTECGTGRPAFFLPTDWSEAITAAVLEAGRVHQACRNHGNALEGRGNRQNAQGRAYGRRECRN